MSVRAFPAPASTTRRACRTVFSSFSKRFSNSARICSREIFPRHSRILRPYSSSSRRIVRLRRRRATIPLPRPSASFRRISNPAIFRPPSRTTRQFSRQCRVKERKGTIIITAATAERVRSISYLTSWGRRCSLATSLPLKAHSLHCSRRSSNLTKTTDKRLHSPVRIASR